MKKRFPLSAISVVLCALFLCFAFFTEDASTAPKPKAKQTSGQPRVVSFTPQGGVKDVKQVVAKFSTRMIPFGDPRPADPFQLNCPEKGRGLWLDEKTWVYDFESELPGGVGCSFTLKPDLKDLNGEMIGGNRNFSFNTGGPGIAEIEPFEDAEAIEENQVFLLTLDARATEESVLSGAFFIAEGIKEPLGVKIIKGPEREKVLKTRHIPKNDKNHRLLISCVRTFPANTRVSLVWGKSISTPSGVRNGADRTLNFKTRPPFQANMRCYRENPNAPCLPLTPIRVVFTSPVSREAAAGVTLKGKDGKSYKPVFEDRQMYNEEDSDIVSDTKKNGLADSVSFRGPFPENSELELSLPKNLSDDSGRTLTNHGKFPLRVKVGENPPLAKFSARFGIIEKNADALLPVTMRNVGVEESGSDIPPAVDVSRPKAQAAQAGTKTPAFVKAKVLHLGPGEDEKIIQWLSKVGRAERKSSIFKSGESVQEMKVPKANGSRAFEVVGIPFKEPGLHVVELESKRLGAALLGAKDASMFVPAAALTTNMSVHFKWGAESSLVWVTTLDKAEPVKGANIRIRDCSGQLLWSGVTGNEGYVRVAGLPSQDGKLKRCRVKNDEQGDSFYDHDEAQSLSALNFGLFVFAEAGGDASFVHSSWDKGIEPWRFRLPDEYQEHYPVAVHTILDRSLYRVGDKAGMKHIVLRKTQNGFGRLKNEEMPNLVRLIHTGGGNSFEFPLKFDAKGVAETEWVVPAGAKLGDYDIRLAWKKGSFSKRQGGEEYWRSEGIKSAGFKVLEFRVPLMRATLTPPKTVQVAPKGVDMDMSLQYLSGGPAKGAEVVLRSRLAPKSVTFPEYPDFEFNAQAVREGVKKIEPGAEGEGEEESPPAGETKPVSRNVTLDGGGAGRAGVEIPQALDAPRDLLAEMEYKDPAGEIRTVSATVSLWPSKVILGIKQDNNISVRDRMTVQVLALDVNGKPQSGVNVVAAIYKKNFFSHRKRIVGGFYAFENVEEIKKLNVALKGKTDSRGLAVFEIKPPASGNLIFTAEAEDDKKNKYTASAETWVSGGKEMWFSGEDMDRIDVIPEKRTFEPNEKAVFQVRMPFREATALITVEREGVMDVYLKKLSGKEPNVEVPLKGHYAPNVFVSVLCVRGRAGDAKPTAFFDPGKPAFKLGVASVNVGRKNFALKVALTPNKTVFKTRENAEIRISVKKEDGSLPPAGTEVALTAVDEGLLELAPNNTLNLLQTMMGKRSYQVRTATAASQVVGKRHFGLKALPAGGGGGKATSRELFDTLLLWKGRITLNAQGEATVQVPLNDSLTSFDIAAVAYSDQGIFGTGHAKIRTTRELQIMSGLPPVVRENDVFRAVFTLRNTSNSKLEVDVNATAAHVPQAGQTAKPLTGLKPLHLSLNPGEAKEAAYDVTAPVGGGVLEWSVASSDKSGKAADALKVRQKIAFELQPRVVQGTITQVDGKYTLDVQKPKDAAQAGGVKVSLTPDLSGGLGGIREYMREYPFTCLEQKVSKAVALRDAEAWKRLTAEMPAYLDAENLLKYFPSSPKGSDVLNSYILLISEAAGFDLPQSVRDKLLEGLRNFVEGKIRRVSVNQSADTTIRRLSAINALAAYGKASPKYFDSLNLEPDYLPTSALIDLLGAVSRMKNAGLTEKYGNRAENVLFGRLDYRGTKLTFTTEKGDGLRWLGVSPDQNAAGFLLLCTRLAGLRQYAPKAAVGLVERMRNQVLDTTTANAWAVTAMRRFSEAFEKSPVDGVTAATLGETEKRMDWGAAPKGGEFVFDWPKSKSGLKIEHTGRGRPWAAIRSLAAIPLTEPLFNGFKIKKTVSAVSSKSPDFRSEGDVLRVRLEFEAAADSTWAVISDSVPAGASILGTGLGGDSKILADKEKKGTWVRPVFEERSFEAYRAYYEYLPQGAHAVEYTIRLNNPGVFRMPPTRAELLYSPDVFGEIPNKPLEVRK